MNAGNRFGIMSQVETLKGMGCEVHFLYIHELPMNGDKKPYETDLEETAAYWGDHFHLFRVNLLEKLIINVYDKYGKFLRNDYHRCDEAYPNRLTGFVRKLQDKYQFDVCVVNYYYLTKLFTRVRFPKTAVFTHDCIAYKNLVVGTRAKTITAHEEAKAMQRTGHIFAVQEEEANYFQLLSPRSKVYNIYCKYRHHPQPVTGNRNILFLSGGNPYNVNGIMWFLADIWPLIRKTYKDAQLLVGGSICNAIKEKVDDTDGLKLCGFISEPAEFFSQGDVAINPIYQGTGLKIKTFESISFDKVTIVHPHSTRGIFDKKNAPLFESEKAEDWLKILDKIWTDKDFIEQTKCNNADYLQRMSAFIDEEYKRFLSSSNHV